MSRLFDHDLHQRTNGHHATTSWPVHPTPDLTVVLGFGLVGLAIGAGLVCFGYAIAHLLRSRQ